MDNFVLGIVRNLEKENSRLLDRMHELEAENEKLKEIIKQQEKKND